MAAYYPENTRWFYANEGDESVNHNGPEGIKHDLRQLGVMFDPNGVHDDDTPGGITLGNMSRNMVDEDAQGELPGDVLKETPIDGLTDTDGKTPSTIRDNIKAVWDRFTGWINSNLKPIAGLSDNGTLNGQIKSLLGLLDTHEETNARAPETGIHGLRVDASGILQYKDTDGTWKNLMPGYDTGTPAIKTNGSVWHPISVSTLGALGGSGGAVREFKPDSIKFEASAPLTGYVKTVTTVDQSGVSQTTDANASLLADSYTYVGWKSAHLGVDDGYEITDPDENANIGMMFGQDGVSMGGYYAHKTGTSASSPYLKVTNISDPNYSIFRNEPIDNVSLLYPAKTASYTGNLSIEDSDQPVTFDMSKVSESILPQDFIRITNGKVFLVDSVSSDNTSGTATYVNENEIPLYYGLDATNQGAAAMDAATGQLILSRVWRYQTVLKHDGLALLDTPLWTVTDSQLGTTGAIGAKDFIVVGLATNDATVDDVQAFASAAPYSIHGSQKDGQFQIGISGTIPSSDIPVFVTVIKASGPDEAPIITSTSPLPNGTVSDPYDYQFTAKGTVTKWTIGTGTLPAGLTLSNSGAISGTPTAVATDTPFTIQCWYNDTQHVDMDFTMTVIAAGTATITGPDSGTFIVGRTDNLEFGPLVASGKTADEIYSWSVTGLPSWAGRESLGTQDQLFYIYGTPDSAGTSTVTVTLNILASDHTTVVSTASKDVTITATSRTVSITTDSPLQTGYINSSYTTTFLASGANTDAGESYSWNVTSGTLPAGLQFNTTTAKLSGTPSAAGASTFTLGVSYVIAGTSSVVSATKDFTITVSSQTSFIPSQVSAGFDLSHCGIDTSLVDGGDAPSLPAGNTATEATWRLDGANSQSLYFDLQVADPTSGDDYEYSLTVTLYATGPLLGFYVLCTNGKWQLKGNALDSVSALLPSLSQVTYTGFATNDATLNAFLSGIIDQIFTFDRS
jgi:hypothetical protein